MFSTKLMAFALTLVGTSCLFAQAQTNTSCNPLTVICPANPGLATSSYFVDFTQQSTLPANWTLANFEHVTYGANGAEFTFAKRRDAPYIWTDFYILFGRVEVIMQAAPGVGIISSSVLISDDQDEIDWEFSGNNFNTASGKAQTNYFGKGIVGNYDRGTYPLVDSPQTQFHTYALDWSPTTLTWSIDGVVARTLSNNNTNSGSYQYPQSPMKLQIGLWDGGDADNAGGTVEWAGGYTNLSYAPFTMYVKSVTITNTNPCSGAYQYTDMSGSYQSIKCVDANILLSSNSTLAPQPNGSNQAGSAPPSSSSPTSSSASPAANSSSVAPTSAAQSSAVVLPVQTSSSTAAPAVLSPMSSTVMSSSSTAIMNSMSGPASTMPPLTSTITTTICTSTLVASATQAPASSSTQPTSIMSPSKAQVCTAPTPVPPFPSSSTSSANLANSTSSVPPTSSSPTSSATISPISPATIPPATSAMIPPTTSTSILHATFTGAANRLLPRQAWMLFFR